MNRPSFLDADGLPFELEEFEFDGRVQSFESFLEADATQTPVPIDGSVTGEPRRRGLTGLEVMTFPG